MNRINVFSIFLAVFLVFGCHDPKQDEVKKLKSKTIELHDIVMPRMGEVSELAAQLKAMREVIASDTSDSVIAVRVSISDQVAKLDASYEGMMDWMAAYEPNYENQAPVDSAIVYYLDQVEKIETVKQKIEESIDEGGKMLEELKH